MQRWFFLAVLLASPLAAQVRTTTHELSITPGNIHWGYYSGSLQPVLEIESGDRVIVETMVVRGLERVYLAGAKPEEVPQRLKDVESSVSDRGPGAHPMTGPIAVAGAEPGDVVEIRMLDIDFIHPFGITYFVPGLGTLPDDFPYSRLRLVRFDLERRSASFIPGVTLPLAPFFGSVGVAPSPMLGRIDTGPPSDHHGGNFDLKELVAGSILYLPVRVNGALISFGDGHAVQGDGEVALTALETSLRGTVQIILHKDRTLLRPRAETPTHWITFGLHTDLDEAARIATSEMVEFLVAERGLGRADAYLLTSLTVDLAVTQLVDGTKGIHAMLPKSIFN